MDTTISASVQQINPYSNPSTNQKKTSDRVDGNAGEGKKSSEVHEADADTGSGTADTVSLSSTRMVSESNQAAAENEVEDIDAIARRIQDVKQWLESEYESSQIQQVHQLDPNNLVEVLS